MAGHSEREGGYERHRQRVNESVDGGGCAETWEALSAQRARPDEPRQQDIEAVLLENDSLQSTGDSEDFELTAPFRRAWQSAFDELDGASLETPLKAAFGLDGAIEIESTERAVVVRHDDRLLGRWVSRPAMVADLAACRVFERRDDDWAKRSAAERSQLAGSVRLYLDVCPDCGGDASFDTDVVSSCCTDYEVATVSCEACGVTLFELPVATEPT